MSAEFGQSPIPSYGSVEAQRIAVGRKFASFEASTYVRYGTDVHAELELRVAELANAQVDETLIFSHGTSAVQAAIQNGLEQSERERPRIAFAHELYPGTIRWIEKYVRRTRAESQRFFAADLENVTDVIEEFEPDVVFAETVANGCDASVLDHRGLLEHARERDHKPFIILDRTLPLSTGGHDVYEALDPEDNACIVESLTKAAAWNRDGFGALYSKNPFVINRLREERAEQGYVPGVGTAKALLESFPDWKGFHQRNSIILEHAGRLARCLHGIGQVATEKFIVRHPSIEGHANYKQAHVPFDGVITPVVFLLPQNLNNAEAFAKRIGDNEEVAHHIQRSDSFAFTRAAFYSSDAAPYVRIAPGSGTDVGALSGALYDALVN